MIELALFLFFLNSILASALGYYYIRRAEDRIARVRADRDILLGKVPRR